MDETTVSAYILGAFPGVETASTGGYTFFFFGSDRMLPFATLATADDEYDRASNLDRRGVYRLNIGVSRDTYRSLLGPERPRLGESGVVDTGHDFTALDRILPHPVYAPQSWVSVLNPSRETFGTVQSLLSEGYDLAVRRAKRANPAEPADGPSV